VSPVPGKQLISDEAFKGYEREICEKNQSFAYICTLFLDNLLQLQNYYASPCQLSSFIFFPYVYVSMFKLKKEFNLSGINTIFGNIRSLFYVTPIGC
jgi:hypothetical protein